MKKSNHYHHLKKRWLKKHEEIEKKLKKSHREAVKSLAPKHHLLSSLIMASVPFMAVTPAIIQPAANAQQEIPHITREKFVKKLETILPNKVEPLTPEQEFAVSKLLSDSFGVNVYPQLNGIRLNRNYGLIGKEQHLRRYPGDILHDHFDNKLQAKLFSSAGTAPGLGAWGYFASSKKDFTTLDMLREKYYIAVPTFLAPGFNEHVGEYGLFFKYRKMLVANPQNGKAVVADIADAGPAQWTGKHLGGSPEVMGYLEREDGAKKGPVLYFFIDDPNDTIALGPREL